MSAEINGDLSGDLATPDLSSAIRRGLAWSGAANIVMRIGSMAVGICLARLLSPEEFGVYGVALVVQTILICLADLGLSADLIRSDDAEKKAPTVATLALVSGMTFTLAMIGVAPYIADALREPQSTAAIQVLSFTLVLAGLGVVPYAALNRAFAQKKLFASGLADFVVGTTVTLVLVVLGWGVLALAVGRIVGHASGITAQFWLAGIRPRFGFDRAVSGPALQFGIPIALANLLSWALLNVDAVVIARGLGTVELGFYVLAFNISTWPMAALGAVVRSVALPGFARLAPGTRHARDPALGRAFAVVWALALPAGCCLALLASPLIAVLYGDKWGRSATALAALGIFGGLRVGFDLFLGYLMARGAARSTLAVQVVWLVVLVPATVAGVRLDGLRGAAWAQVVVAVVVVFPAFLVVLSRARADVGAILASVWPPVLAMLPTGLAVLMVVSTVDSSAAQLFLGALTATAVYLAVLGRWIRVRIPERGGSGDLSTTEVIEPDTTVARVPSGVGST